LLSPQASPLVGAWSFNSKSCRARSLIGNATNGQESCRWRLPRWIWCGSVSRSLSFGCCKALRGVGRKSPVTPIMRRYHAARSDLRPRTQFAHGRRPAIGYRPSFPRRRFDWLSIVGRAAGSPSPLVTLLGGSLAGRAQCAGDVLRAMFSRCRALHVIGLRWVGGLYRLLICLLSLRGGERFSCRHEVAPITRRLSDLGM